jgi:hypothetical protein
MLALRKRCHCCEQEVLETGPWCTLYGPVRAYWSADEDLPSNSNLGMWVYSWCVFVPESKRRPL